MLDPHLFLTGMNGAQSPYTRPSSPAEISPMSPGNNGICSDKLLMELQMFAFSEHGIGSELESL
jgi:hypothetical protein